MIASRKQKNKNYIEENTLIKLKKNGNKNAKNKNIGKHSTKVVGEETEKCKAISLRCKH